MRRQNYSSLAGVFVFENFPQFWEIVSILSQQVGCMLQFSHPARFGVGNLEKFVKMQTFPILAASVAQNPAPAARFAV